MRLYAREYNAWAVAGSFGCLATKRLPEVSLKTSNRCSMWMDVTYVNDNSVIIEA